MTDLKDIRAKLLADMFRLDEEFLLGSAVTVNTSQTQSEISFPEMMETYRKLTAAMPPRKMFLVDADTALELPPDMVNSPDVIVLPRTYQEMQPRQWKRRKFHPPYRKVALRPRWVKAPEWMKGILAVDAPRSVFR